MLRDTLLVDAIAPPPLNYNQLYYLANKDKFHNTPEKNKRYYETHKEDIKRKRRERYLLKKTLA